MFIFFFIQTDNQKQLQEAREKKEVRLQGLYNATIFPSYHSPGCVCKTGAVAGGRRTEGGQESGIFTIHV